MLLAVAVDHVGQLALGQAVDRVARAAGRAAVQAHVERAVGLEAEAALRRSELHRAHAEVEQHAVRALGAQRLGDRAEVRVDEAHAVASRREPLLGQAQRLAVAVEGQQPPLGGAVAGLRSLSGGRGGTCGAILSTLIEGCQAGNEAPWGRLSP